MYHLHLLDTFLHLDEAALQMNLPTKRNDL